MNSQTEPLTCDAAQTLLRQFTCIENFPVEPLPAKAMIQQAVLLMRDYSDYQIFGICADSAEQAIAALHSYLIAFGMSDVPQIDAIAGAVYLKYNLKTGLCYLQPYTGTHRGVLLSCQSADDGDVNETFGHLPLDLFQSGD